MAGKKSTVTISVVAETKKFQKAMRQLGDVSGLKKLGSTMSQLGSKLLQVSKYAGAAASTLGAIAVKHAADLEQSAGAVQDVFKNYAATVSRYSRQAATSVGLSANAYNELATLIGTQLKNGGTSIDQLAGKTNNLITLGADLAAGFGGSTADAVNALSSALKGERDPIERYGVSLTQAAIDAEAASLGFHKVGGALSVEANQAATLSLIMKQTADFHGKFAAENTTLAHQLQVVQAKLTDMAATLGTLLLPYVTQIVAWLSEKLTPAFEQFMAWLANNAIPKIKELAAVFATEWLPRLQAIASELAAVLLPALTSLGSFITGTIIPAVSTLAAWLIDNRHAVLAVAIAIGTFLTIFKTVITITTTVPVLINTIKIAMATLNAVMAANPIGLIAAAIGALIAVLVYLWNTNEGFRNALTAAWGAIQNAISAAVGFIIGLWDGLIAAIGAVGAWFATLAANIAAIWSAIYSTIAGFIASIVGAVAGFISAVIGFYASLPSKVISAVSSMAAGVRGAFGAVISFFASVPSRILGALGNLGSLLFDVGKTIIQGFLDGIRSMFGAVKDALGTLTSWLPDWKGPAALDKRILRDSGRMVIGGFIDGLEDRYSAVRASLGSLTTSLDSAINMPTLARAHTYHGAGGTPIIINLTSLTPTIETGRVIAKSLDSYLAANRRGAMA